MIRDTHIQTLRELVEQSERDLAGYRRILERAEQEQRVGMILPDPIVSAPTAVQWPAPPTPPVVPAGLPPYQNGSVWDGMLPPKQENAFGAFEQGHDELAAQEQRDGKRP